MNERANMIIETAIQMIREGGYHSFSFRQIATELDIKSASIHYHFPTKEDLGVAVAKRYTEEFLTALGKPSDHSKPVHHYIGAFQASLERHQSSCVCGILAAEAGRLPVAIREALANFTAENIAWLERALAQQCPEWSESKVKDSATSMFSALEGGITFAALTGETDHLSRVATWLMGLVD